MTKRSMFALVALVGALASREAHADDSAAADALWQQGKALADKEQWAEACPKFQASYKLDPQLGSLLNLADCDEHMGRLATAWARFGEGMELAKKAGDKRLTYAKDRRDKLATRLPMLQIDVTGRSASLGVYRDDDKVEPGAFGVPLPVDPGAHLVTVRRGAEVLAKIPVNAVEAQTASAAIDLARIEREAPPPPPPQGSVVVVSGVQRPLGYLVGGLGVATIVAAGVLEIVAISEKSKANDPNACVAQICTPEGLAAVNRARDFATAGQWVGLGGILVTAIGVTLVLAAPSTRVAPAPRAISAAPLVAKDGGGVSLRGSF